MKRDDGGTVRHPCRVDERSSWLRFELNLLGTKKFNMLDVVRVQTGFAVEVMLSTDHAASFRATFREQIINNQPAVSC